VRGRLRSAAAAVVSRAGWVGLFGVLGLVGLSAVIGLSGCVASPPPAPPDARAPGAAVTMPEGASGWTPKPGWHAACGFRQPDRHHLPGIVPFIDRRRDIEPLIALQPDQAAPQRPGQHLGDLGLADARLPFEQDRSFHLQREEDDGGERAISHIFARRQQRLGVGDGGG